MWEAATYRRSGWNLGGMNTKGRQNIKEDSWGCKKWQTSVILTDWMESLVGAVEGKRSVLEKPERRRSDLEFTLRPKSQRRHLQGGAGDSGSAFMRSPIGLANKLVQFKKRPLVFMLSESCLHKKTYEKNLWYKEFQNTRKKLHLDVLSPSCYTFIKEGVR